MSSNPLHDLASALYLPWGDEEYEPASRIVSSLIAGEEPAAADWAVFGSDPLAVLRRVVSYIRAAPGTDVSTAVNALRAVLLGDEPAPVVPVVKPAAKPAKAKGRRPPAVCPCEPGAKPKDLRRNSKQVCPVDGCTCLTWRGNCKAHARHSSTTGDRYRDSYRQANSADLGRWRKASKRHLADHPLCASGRCSAVAVPLRPAATEVDHIDGLGLQGPRAFDPGNWMSLCHACHSAKTARESFGHG